MNILLPCEQFDSLSNGLDKNVIFLKTLLSELGFAVDTQLCKNKKYDYLIQTNKTIGLYEFNILKSNNPNMKNIHVIYGNKMIADIENVKTQKMPLNTREVDEVWVSPHYSETIPYFKIYYNTESVFILPYIWTPDYINIEPYTYPRTGKKIITIIEPNLSLVKSCLPCILIAESVYNKNPKAFDRVDVYCSEQFQSSKYFLGWSQNLNLVKDNKIKFKRRTRFEEVFGYPNQFIVSHQFMNDLNYVYMEALYLNIPLIHNSKTLKEVGYYYNGYDLIDGANKLELSLNCENNKSIQDKLNCELKILFDKHSPHNPQVINAYKNMFRKNT